MRRRTALSTGLIAVLLAGATSPSLAGPKPKPKPKPKPITGSYQTPPLTPDPTNNNVQGVCNGVTPTSRHDFAFTVPAAGFLDVSLANTLDWAIALLATDGEVLATADGSDTTQKESTGAKFKKKQKVIIRTCNFAGEPQVKVSYKFTYK